MDSVPQTPDQQTRNAVTTRITAHVTAGWPRLGEPLVRHRGQYCYVAALCRARTRTMSLSWYFLSSLGRSPILVDQAVDDLTARDPAGHVDCLAGFM